MAAELTPESAVRLLMEKFGRVYIPVKLDSASEDLANRCCYMFGNRLISFPLRYVRICNGSSEWRRQLDELVANGMPKFSKSKYYPSRKRWKIWEAEYASTEDLRA